MDKEKTVKKNYDLDNRLVTLMSAAQERFRELVKAVDAAPLQYIQAYEAWADAHEKAGRLADLLENLEETVHRIDAEDEYEDEDDDDFEDLDDEEDLDFEDDDEEDEDCICGCPLSTGSHTSECPVGEEEAEIGRQLLREHMASISLTKPPQPPEQEIPKV